MKLSGPSVGGQQLCVQPGATGTYHPKIWGYYLLMFHLDHNSRVVSNYRGNNPAVSLYFIPPVLCRAEIPSDPPLTE